MKIGIIYYSRTGNTKFVAEKLEEKLKNKKIDVKLIEIKHVKKPGFFKAGYATIKQKELPIINTDFDLKKYDMLIVGSPTWVGRPSPYIRSYFNKVENIKGKKAGIFFTCAGSVDSAKTGEIIKEYLKTKGMEINTKILKLQMKKRKIKYGEKNIDDFVIPITEKN